MRTHGIFFIALLSSFGCSNKTTPNEVVENYSTNVASANHVREINYSKHLSERAQGRVVEGLKKVTPILVDFDFSLSINDSPLEIKNKTIKVSSNANEERMFGFFLKLLKAEVTPCSTGEFETTINGAKATLTCAEKDYTDQYGEVWQEYTRNFMLVNENGWRIDKIESTYTHDSGTNKSTTFE